MRVLVADDDEGVLMAITLLLEREGISTTRATSPDRVLEELSRPGAAAPFDAILLDLNYERDTTSGQEGFTLLSRLRREHPRIPVVVMTGWASIEGAVEAMRRGALDYLPKPWDNARLVALLRDLSSRTTSGVPRSEQASRTCLSPAMQRLYATIEQVAFSDIPILITGEHGTGKELVARAVHEQSGRKGAFVALNAGALADGTFESELFGHVRGAYTDAKSAREGAFARAEGGTLFLDELANMPFGQQAKLLRVLQDRVYQPLGASAPRASTARVVSATNADVDVLAQSGRLRPDLLYRLNTIRLHVPPLRERRSELSGLVQWFVEREVARYGLPLPHWGADVTAALQAHEWPGNVRELEHVLQRAVLLSARSGELTPQHLDLPSAGRAISPSNRELPKTALAQPPQTVRDAERAAILLALERFPEDRRAAAESLGLSRSAFYRRLSQHGIVPK